jgi:hypothetical protein
MTKWSICSFNHWEYKALECIAVSQHGQGWMRSSQVKHTSTQLTSSLVTELGSWCWQHHSSLLSQQLARWARLFRLYSRLTRGTALATQNILYFWCLFVLHVVDILFGESFCRVINFWLHVLLFLRKDPSMLNLPLLSPKPPRLEIIKMGMKSKVLWRGVTPRCRLLSLNLRCRLQRGSGSAQKNWLPRVHPTWRMHSEGKLLLRAPPLISMGCLNRKCSHICSLSSLGPYFFLLKSNSFLS